MKKATASAIFAMFMLTGCGQSAENPADQTEEAASETPIPVEPDGGIGDGAQPLPEQSETDNPAVIPAAYHGTWDYIEGTCARESDLRVQISASEIMFYESIGTIEGVREAGEDIVVTLAMEGEGERWQQHTRLTLSENGERLDLTDPERPDDAGSLLRKRCS